MSLQNGQRTEAESEVHLWLHFIAHEFTPQQTQVPVLSFLQRKFLSPLALWLHSFIREIILTFEII